MPTGLEDHGVEAVVGYCYIAVSLEPHYVHDEQLQASYAVEVIGDNEEECIDVVSMYNKWERR